jgi:hypothetical protein
MVLVSGPAIHSRSFVTPQSDALQSVRLTQASLPGDNRALEPPDPIPNSEVKRRIADGSVGFPHVRVGHRQASKKENPLQQRCRGFCFLGLRDLQFRPDAAREGCPVTDPVPQERGGGAPGVAKRWRACSLPTAGHNLPFGRNC